MDEGVGGEAGCSAYPGDSCGLPADVVPALPPTTPVACGELVHCRLLEEKQAEETAWKVEEDAAAKASLRGAGDPPG
jgi:hypothetical protein